MWNDIQKAFDSNVYRLTEFIDDFRVVRTLLHAN